MRLAAEGGKINYLNMANSKVNTSFLFLHPDMMINLSNWIGGYREWRAYSAILTGGAGMHTSRGYHALLTWLVME